MATKKKAVKKPAPKAAKAKKPAARKLVAKKAAQRPVTKQSAVKSSAANPPKDMRRKPETMRIAETAPGFTVNDLPASLVFYRDILGMIVEEEWKNKEGVLMGIGLKAGSTSFMIGQDDWAKGHDRQKGIGFRLYCTITQDIDQIAAGIEARGGKLDSQPTDQPWKMRDFSITDPDGFKITIGTEI